MTSPGSCFSNEGLDALVEADGGYAGGWGGGGVEGLGCAVEVVHGANCAV